MDEVGAVPEDEGFGGVEGELGEAEEEAGELAAAEAALLGEAEVVVEEGEDFGLGVEGCHCSYVAYSFSCYHACFCMGFCCVSCESFQG